MEKNAYFKMDNKYIYLNAPQADFYLPMDYFKSPGGFAEEKGSIIRTIGIFDVGFKNEKGDITATKVFNVPTWIELFIGDTDMDKVKLAGYEEPIDCMILHYRKGDKIMNNGTIEDSSNCESYLQFILKGKLPDNIPYEKSLRIWEKNQDLNGVGLGVTSVIEELILAGIYRYKNDPTKKFAQVIGRKPNTSQFDYRMLNIREICQYSSTFTALTFEDFDSMVTTSLNRTRTKQDENYSPVEQLLKL